MKKLPIGKQEFKGLIESNCIYIDKTEFLIKLINSSAPVFLSRPRRFGKSLMVNTFKELFKGNKELFKETYAYNNWDFERIYPVIRLDLSRVFGDTAKEIDKQLCELVRDHAENFEISIAKKTSSNIALNQLIKKAGKDKTVVILIDEYDAPILDNLDNPNLPGIKKVLRAFYKIIKASEEYIRFIFITGISKFTHVGVFSAMNHLEDITLDSSYATVAGYTEQEICAAFSQQIALVKTKHALSEKLFWEKLAHYYDGYSWDGEHFVYNPLSILRFLKSNGDFIPYWMETGSPEYIIRYAEDKKFDITKFEQLKVLNTFLSKRDIDRASPESFLTQAGYLTIKKREEESYTLDFPNQEVRRSFCELILNAQYATVDSDILNVNEKLGEALNAQNVDKMIDQFKIIYSSIPYVHFDSNKTEHFYSSLLLMYLQAAGFDAFPERLSNKGRLDLSIQYKERVYIFELKVSSAQKAIEQIIEKNYAGAYKNKQVTLVGLQIDFDERNIVTYKSESL